jgi:hypothetical protein
MLKVRAVGSVLKALANIMVGRVQPQRYVETNVGISSKLRDVGEMTRGFSVVILPWLQETSAGPDSPLLRGLFLCRKI